MRFLLIVFPFFFIFSCSDKPLAKQDETKVKLFEGTYFTNGNVVSDSLSFKRMKERITATSQVGTIWKVTKDSIYVDDVIRYDSFLDGAKGKYDVIRKKIIRLSYRTYSGERKNLYYKLLNFSKKDLNLVQIYPAQNRTEIRTDIQIR